MIELQVPGYADIRINHIVSDFSGTLSIDGLLVKGVRERLNNLSELVDIHIVTADTHGMVESELSGVKCRLTMLTGGDQDMQKLRYIEKLGKENVAAIGNGNNDRKMLAAAGIGIVVCTAEGASIDAIMAAMVMAHSPLDALDLLLNPVRLRATLRL